MDQKEKEILKEKILEQMTSLKKEISYLKDSIKPIPPDDSIGRLTRMEATNEKKMKEAQLYLKEQRLKTLEKLIDKVDEKDFAYCKNCDNPIPLKRLLLVPESSICLDCIKNK
jgi:DnaK suppressor protein